MLVGGANVSWGQTVLFSQSFDAEDAGFVDYTANTARNYTTENGKTLDKIVGSGNNLFTSITCNAKNSCGIGINSATGGNSKDYTGKFGAYYNNTSGYWSICKTSNFAITAPTAIKIEMNAAFAYVSSGSNIGVQIAVGSDFSDGLTNSCPALNKCVAGFSLPSNSSIKISKYVVSNSVNNLSSSTLTDGTSYKYTWIINNTNEILTYKDPTGTDNTVAANCWDLWIGTTLYCDNVTKTTTGMSGTSLDNLYIGSPFGKKHEFILDDITVTDLSPATSHTVSYNANGGTGIISDVTGESITLSDGTGFSAPSGYTFAGWNTAANGSGTNYAAGTSVSTDLNLYAKWQQTVTLNTGLQGNESDKTPTVLYNGVSLADFSAHTATGYSLQGYYTATSDGTKVLNADGTFAAENVTDYIASGAWTKIGATTLYAQWEAATFTLNVDVNEDGYGTVYPASVANVPYNSVTSSSTNTFTVNGTTVTATPTAATAEYTYAFDSWSNLPANVTANATVTANFTRTANSYTLAWDANDGDALTGTYTSGTVAYGTTITAPNTPTRDGYVFKGWATSANGEVVTVNTMPAANTTYYAQWAQPDCILVPATSGEAPSDGDVIDMQDGSFGGVMKALSANLSYTTNGLQFGTNSGTKTVVYLNKKMQAGTVITLTLVAGGTSARGLKLYNSDGKNQITTLGWTGTVVNGAEETFTYTVKSTDDIVGSNIFQLWRNNTVTLKSLTVSNCGDPFTVSLNASGYGTFSFGADVEIEGADAYTAALDFDKEKITCAKITNKKIPAGEGVLLFGTANAVVTMTCTSGVDALSNNNLKGTTKADGSLATMDKDNYNYYSLSGNTFKNYTGTTFVANKAYFEIASGQSAPNFTIEFDEGGTTSMSLTPTLSEGEGVWYDLSGHKLQSKPTAKGIYIMNGKKVIIK